MVFDCSDEFNLSCLRCLLQASKCGANLWILPGAAHSVCLILELLPTSLKDFLYSHDNITNCGNPNPLGSPSWANPVASRNPSPGAWGSFIAAGWNDATDSRSGDDSSDISMRSSPSLSPVKIRGRNEGSAAVGHPVQVLLLQGATCGHVGQRHPSIPKSPPAAAAAEKTTDADNTSGNAARQGVAGAGAGCGLEVV